MLNLSEKYEPLFSSDSRYYVVTGGRGSGKSFSVNSFLLLLTYEVGHVILFTRYTLVSAHISIIPEFIEKIDELELHSHFYVTKDEIVNVTTGSKILFRGIKTSSGTQTANLKSLTGVTTWVVDEAEELTDENTFEKIDLSIRSKTHQNRVILVLNPATKEHFIYKRFFERTGVQEGSNSVKGDTTYIHTTYIDNHENLSESFISQVESIKENNPNKYKHTILGGWLNKAEGVIFDNWEVGEFQEIDEPIYGQDYGFSIDPTTLIKVSIDKVNQKIYVKELMYQKGLSTSQIFDITKQNVNRSLVIGDSAEPRLISELRSMGLNIKEAIKGQGSITAGISLIQDFKIIVSPDSTNLMSELNNYCWLESKSKTPIDDYNHLLDALRYAVTYRLKNRNAGQYNVAR